jgi:hypothetical protein
MDANRFDTLTRSMCDPLSRRELVRGFTAITLGLVGAHLPGTALARKKRKHKHKKKHKRPKTCQSGTENCRGQCVDLCPSGRVRHPGTCDCCRINTGSCSAVGYNADCCSESCEPVSTVFNACAGRAALEGCEFDAQCATGACSPDGLCYFAAP